MIRKIVNVDSDHIQKFYHNISYHFTHHSYHTYAKSMD
jgi:hypothetical protein